MAEILVGDKLADEMAKLKDWQLMVGRDALHRNFVFRNFNEAFGFMSRAALQAEKLDHHPEWSNIYKTVYVTLTTHNDGKGHSGISDLDIKLARFMDSTASQFGL